MYVRIAIKKGAKKWHILHDLAMCETAAELAFYPWRYAVRTTVVFIDEREPKGVDSFLTLDNGRYVDPYDVCQVCSRALFRAITHGWHKKPIYVSAQSQLEDFTNRK